VGLRAVYCFSEHILLLAAARDWEISARDWGAAARDWGSLKLEMASMANGNNLSFD
jgi:hypothetical protein